MTIIFQLFGGLGLFIYGMHLMSEGLKTVAGSNMRKLLEKLTNTPLKAVICGIIVTIMVQSSSTTTVMVVGFVNASLMNLNQAAGIILGSNIGTTVMAQIIAFDITSYAVVFIGVGTLMALFGRKKRMRDWGSIILGFGILFFGIHTMSNAVTPLKDSPEFINILLTYGKNPFLGLLAATGMTAVLQSSGAIIGLVQALALSGVFASTNGTEAIQICIPLIIGSNIGTCITALLSSIGTSNAAKDAAIIHLFVNIFGAVWVMLLIFILNQFFPVNPIYELIDNLSGTININGQIVPNVARQIAMAHTLFNVANSVVLFPFINVIVKVVEKILPPEPAEESIQLDERLLNTPGVALGAASDELCKMSRICTKNVGRAMDALIDLDEAKIDKVLDVENTLDSFETELQNYVLRAINLNMSQKENDQAAFILENSHYIERIGDHAENLADLAQEMRVKGTKFSASMKNAMVEIKQDIGKMLDTVEIVLKDPKSNSVNQLKEDKKDYQEYIEKLRKKRINRNHLKDERIFPTFVFVDILTNIERISHLTDDIASSCIHLEEEKSMNPIEEIVY